MEIVRGKSRITVVVLLIALIAALTACSSAEPATADPATEDAAVEPTGTPVEMDEATEEDPPATEEMTGG